MRVEGKIRFFRHDRGGWGAIDCDDGRSVYFHIRNFKRKMASVHAGYRVSFVVADSGRGPQASAIQIVGEQKCRVINLHSMSPGLWNRRWIEQIKRSEGLRLKQHAESSRALR
jgi:cold shock CspA family protein